MGSNTIHLLRLDNLLLASRRPSFGSVPLGLVTYKAAVEACSCSFVLRCAEGSGQGAASAKWLSRPGWSSSSLVCRRDGSVWPEDDMFESLCAEAFVSLLIVVAESPCEAVDFGVSDPDVTGSSKKVVSPALFTSLSVDMRIEKRCDRVDRE